MNKTFEKNLSNSILKLSVKYTGIILKQPACSMKSKAGESAGPLLYLHMFGREGCVEGVFNSYLVQNTFHRFHNSWYLILSVTVPLYSFCIALFLNSYCEINTLPSIDVIVIQRLFYWHYLLLTIYWSNFMLVLFHCYFTIMLLHCSIHTNLCCFIHTTVSEKDTMEIMHAWNTECSD